MPDNISQRDGQAEVMVVSEPAWQSLGTVLNEPATAEQAIQAAHAFGTSAEPQAAEGRAIRPERSPL
jgi:hypothetical protein